MNHIIDEKDQRIDHLVKTMTQMSKDIQQRNADFATVLDLLTGVKHMVETQAADSEIDLNNSPIYKWILQIIEMSHPGLIIVEEIERLRKNREDVDNAFEPLIERIGLIPGGVYENPLAAIDAISRRWDEVKTSYQDDETLRDIWFNLSRGIAEDEDLHPDTVEAFADLTDVCRNHRIEIPQYFGRRVLLNGEKGIVTNVVNDSVEDHFSVMVAGVEEFAPLDNEDRDILLEDLTFLD